MSDKLTSNEKSMILESLRYTKLKFENYDQYPSYEFKQGRINEVNEVIEKVKSLSTEG